MGKVIHFSEPSEEAPFSEKDFDRLGLEKLLSRYRRTTSKKYQEIEGLKIVKLKNKKEVRGFLEGLISKEIVKRKDIHSEYFFCGNYISHLLSSFVNSHPDSWIAFDHEKEYLESNKVEWLMRGADICFLICSIFEDRKGWRLTPEDFYYEKGRSMYYQLYLKERKKIGFYMCDNFEEMANITRSAILGGDQ
ncbi:MAG: hypothetical protein ACQESA_03035 [Patescibacteria group bacterium]